MLGPDGKPLGPKPKAEAKAKGRPKAKAKGKAKAKAKAKAAAKAGGSPESEENDDSEEEHSSAPYNNEKEEKELKEAKKQKTNKVKISAMKLLSTKSYGESTPRNKLKSSDAIFSKDKVPEGPNARRSQKVGDLFRTQLMT